MLTASQRLQRLLSSARLPLLIGLAKRLGKPISIFDLETTTFMGRPTFGVTEVAIARIFPDGTFTFMSDLCDPENPIDPKVVALNGITDEMVKGKPNFSHWAPIFQDLCLTDVIVGFNSTSFDLPGVKDQAKRYGFIVETDFCIDVRSRYVALMRPYGNGQKGKLAEVLETFGIPPNDVALLLQSNGDEAFFHRAGFDVGATVLICEAILEHYGLAGLLGNPLHKIPEVSDKPQSFAPEKSDEETRIHALIEEHGYDKHKIAQLSGYGVNKVSDTAWTLYKAGHIRIEQIVEQEIQDWIHPHIGGVVDIAWADESVRGRYKPVMTALCAIEGAPFIDYTQLKVALTRSGLK